MFNPLMGDGFNDLFGGQMRMINSMMNSAFGNGDMFAGGAPPSPMSQSMGMMPFANGPANMMFPPMAFPNMNQMMSNMNQMSNNPNCHSFSTSSMMTMSTGPDGKPQVYQASSSTRSAPGGVCETKKTVCDSRTGLKKMAIGHHIGDRAHIKEKEQNIYSGELEENEELINLDEEEAPEFSREWQNRTQYFRSPNMQQAIGPHTSSQHGDNAPQYLALPPASSSKPEEQRNKSPQKKRKNRSQPYHSRKEKKSE